MLLLHEAAGPGSSKQALGFSLDTGFLASTSALSPSYPSAQFVGGWDSAHRGELDLAFQKLCLSESQPACLVVVHLALEV